MKLKQITVPMENSHDRLYEVTKAFTGRGIIPRALTLVDKGYFGELRILVSDLKAARQLLMQMGIPGRVDDVIALQIENRLDQLSLIFKAVMDAGITITYSYEYVGSANHKSIMIFCFSDNEKAAEVLSKCHIHTLDYRDLDMLEAAA